MISRDHRSRTLQGNRRRPMDERPKRSAYDQAIFPAMSDRSAPSIGIRTCMASARLNPVGRARTSVLFILMKFQARRPRLNVVAVVRSFNPGRGASVRETDMAQLALFVTIVAVPLLLLEFGMQRVASCRAAGLAPPTIRLSRPRTSLRRSADDPGERGWSPFPTGAIPVPPPIVQPPRDDRTSSPGRTRRPAA